MDLLQDRNFLIGQVGEFKETAKLKELARQGQMLSSSTQIKDIGPGTVKVAKDVRDESYVFSDGCGYASPELMDEVARIFKFSKVSAIQMRYAGFKGVLVAHPGLTGSSQ